jgi:D-arabinose 1-dehydrogenase-like Zn-dependent alcohol dehydrogenase
MEVGFVGLGRMGQAMARNLLKMGHRVFVFNRTRSRTEELREEGATVADSPAGACKDNIVITMLADDDAVEEVVLGSGRLLSALREDAIHVSMNTITVTLSEILTEAITRRASISSPRRFSDARKPQQRQSSSSSPPANRSRSIAASCCSTTSERKHLSSISSRRRPIW